MQCLWWAIIFLASGVLAYARTAADASGSSAIEEQLNAAIIRSSELDAEQEDREAEAKEKLLMSELWSNFSRVLHEADESTYAARGKLHKHRKVLKYLYPLAVALVVAKAVLLPLLLKLITAMSASSFVMSKVALVLAGMLLLRWLFVGPHTSTASYGEPAVKHVRIIHPLAFKANHFEEGADWSDYYPERTSVVDTRTKPFYSTYLPLKSEAAGGAKHSVGSSAYEGGMFL